MKLLVCLLSLGVALVVADNGACSLHVNVSLVILTLLYLSYEFLCRINVMRRETTGLLEHVTQFMAVSKGTRTICTESLLMTSLTAWTIFSWSLKNVCNLFSSLKIQASSFSTDKVNRMGFSKFFMEKSDTMWSKGKDMIKYVLKRGGKMGTGFQVVIFLCPLKLKVKHNPNGVFYATMVFCQKGEWPYFDRKGMGITVFCWKGDEYSRDSGWPRRPWPNAGRKKQKKLPKNHLFFLKK